MNFVRRLFKENSLFKNIRYFSAIQTSMEKKTFESSTLKKNHLANINQVSSDLELINYQQIRNYKVKTRLRKRCKSCVFIWRNGRLYVECKEHPRHKQHHKDSLIKGYDNIPHGYHVPNI